MDFRIFFVPLPVGLICLARRFKPLSIYISFLLDLFFCPLESFCDVPEKSYLLRNSFYSALLNTYSALLNTYSALLNTCSTLLNKDFIRQNGKYKA